MIQVGRVMIIHAIVQNHHWVLVVSATAEMILPNVLIVFFLQKDNVHILETNKNITAQPLRESIQHVEQILVALPHAQTGVLVVIWTANVMHEQYVVIAQNTHALN